MLVISLLAVTAILIGLGSVFVIVLWKKGKTAEAISLINTVLLLVVILLLIFPPHV